jgi:hypothetical protein
MDLLGSLEEFVAEHLYPYRWPITLGLMLGLAGLLLLGLRLGWHRAIWRHRLATAAILIPLLAVVLPIGWYLASPLWERSYLEEASPLASTAALPSPPPGNPAFGEGAMTQPPTPALPRQTHAGTFMGADSFHFGRGDVLLIESAPGTYTLRFEDFSVRNGPDLYVYLTPDRSGASIDGAVNLGRLKATDGAFNYEIPPGTDVSQFSSAIVWCRQFSALFAVAELMPV